jgi:hypothetical protein
MTSRHWQVGVLAVACAMAALGAAQARDDKPADEGKAEEFKGKSFDVKEKGKVSVTLTFPAGKEATITVKGEKKTDVHLFVYDAAGKQVAKDDSPGPDCEVKITPKEAGKYTLEIRNLGPGDTRAALKVSLGKAKD